MGRIYIVEISQMGSCNILLLFSGGLCNMLEGGPLQIWQLLLLKWILLNMRGQFCLKIWAKLKVLRHLIGVRLKVENDDYLVYLRLYWPFFYSIRHWRQPKVPFPICWWTCIQQWAQNTRQQSMIKIRTWWQRTKIKMSQIKLNHVQLN